MGKYHSYAKRINTLVKERFTAYEKARDEYEDARKDRYTNSKPISEFADPEIRIARNEAENRYIQAEANLKKVTDALQDTLSDVEGIKAELIADVSEEWKVNPDDLDRNTVDLLQSGICSPQEIADLFDRATNPTTKRYIGQFASEEIKRLPTSWDKAKALQATTLLNNVAHQGSLYRDVSHAEPVMRINAVADVLRRCVRTPSMMHEWDNLTSENLSAL